MRTKTGVLLTVYCFLFFGTADASGPARISQKFKEYTAQANSKIESVLDSYNFPSKQTTEIVWNIGPSGEVLDPHVATSCGDSTADMACLEAVLSWSPENKKYAGVSRTFRFSSKTNSKPSGKKQFLERNPSIGRDTVLVYVIPLSVGYRYPSLFSTAELHSADNVTVIGTNQTDKKIVRFFNGWSKFFEMNSTATKESIQQQANKLSSMLLGKD